LQYTDLLCSWYSNIRVSAFTLIFKYFALYLRVKKAGV